MASTSTRPTRSAAPAGGRDARLAELVAELAGCDGDLALDAVRGPAARDADDPLEAVARAITGIRHLPEPQDRFRVAGFLRPERRLPRRRARGAPVEDRPDGYGLVHHGSLRRWDRSGEATVHPRPGEDDVIDLRDDTARFRRPGPA